MQSSEPTLSAAAALLKTILEPFTADGPMQPEEYRYPLASLIPVLAGVWPPFVAIASYLLVSLAWSSCIAAPAPRAAPLAGGEATRNGRGGGGGGGEATREPRRRVSFGDALVFLHNIVLAVFSFLCHRSLMMPMMEHLFAASTATTTGTYASFQDRFCDSENHIWRSHAGYWSWLFYLSKYYEFIDTLIILLKGRRPSILQLYHHTGVIICLHVGFYSRTSTLAYFVVINSFIHTIMYVYFALTAISVRLPVRQFITSLQITQFLTGIGIGSYAVYAHYSSGKKCFKKERDFHSVVYNLLYLVPLLKLFVEFFLSSYFAKRAEKTKIERVSQSKKKI